MAAERVLVVDDDPFLRDLIRQQLEQRDYRVDLARGGVEALRRSKQTAPDLILLDMNMPDMGGLQTLCHLKADPDLANIPVLMLTAQRTERHVVEAAKLGAVAYVAKPFRVEVLMGRITHLLDGLGQKTGKSSRVAFLD